MRRFGQLYQKITSFENLLFAAKLAQRGKRFKNKTAYFNAKLEYEIVRLQDELNNKTYCPGRYKNFRIFEPKERVISAAPYRDRVVHHALNNVLSPIFEPTFIFDSYATRIGKGTHAAINRFQRFAKVNRYALKCDIKKYFLNVDCNMMLDLIKCKIRCKDTLWLVKRIIDSGANIAASQPASQPASKGLPIGNLTSQFFANIYLNGLDHFVKEVIRCRYYLRYMDDFLLLHDDKNFLWQAKAQIIDCLAGLKLELHDNKCRIFHTSQGVPFLGVVIFPKRIRIKRQNLVRYRHRLKNYQRLDQRELIEWRSIHQSVQSWVGHVKHTDSWRIRGLVLKDVVFQRQAGG